MPFAAWLGHWRKHAHAHPVLTTRLVIIGLIAATAVLMSYLDLATLAAGLGLFLWGMQYLEKGIKQLSGGKLERWLQQATHTRPRAILFGAATTATVQSSSLMTLLSMSFVSAGLVTLPAGIALLFGANLGTTTGAWLMATFGLSFDLARYAMPFLAAGLLGARLLPKSLRGYAHLLMGIGLLFLGIDFMKLGFSAWQDSLSLAGLAGTQFWHWPLYVLFGVIATVVMQSSHATLLITLTALASGQLDYLPALAVAVGANVGTTVTALLGALGASTAAKRLAGAHIIFNLLTAGVALALLLPLAWVVDFSSALIGIDADAWPLKLALFHTLFNVLGIVLMLPFITPLANWLERLLPSPAHHLDRAQARYLDASALQHPDTALSALDQECRRLERRAYHLLCNALLIRSADALGHLPTREKIEQAIDTQRWPAVNERYHERIKPLLSEILAFYARLEAPLADDQQAYLEARLQQTFRLVEAVRFGEVLQRSLLRHATNDSPLREGHDALRLALAQGLNYLNRRSEENTVNTSTLADPIYTASQFWQEETARRLRQQRLAPAQASTLINDFHQASRLIDALMPSMASKWQHPPSPG